MLRFLRLGAVLILALQLVGSLPVHAQGTAAGFPMTITDDSNVAKGLVRSESLPP